MLRRAPPVGKTNNTRPLAIRDNLPAGSADRRAQPLRLLEGGKRRGGDPPLTALKPVRPREAALADPEPHSGWVAAEAGCNLVDRQIGTIWWGCDCFAA